MFETRHFSLPKKIIDWIERNAAERGLKRSTYLAFVLTKLIDEEEAKERS